MRGKNSRKRQRKIKMRGRRVSITPLYGSQTFTPLLLIMPTSSLFSIHGHEEVARVKSKGFGIKLIRVEDLFVRQGENLRRVEVRDPGLPIVDK